MPDHPNQQDHLLVLLENMLLILAEQQRTITRLQNAQSALIDFARRRDASFDSDFQQDLTNVQRAQKGGFADEVDQQIASLLGLVRQLKKS